MAEKLPILFFAALTIGLIAALFSVTDTLAFQERRPVTYELDTVQRDRLPFTYRPDSSQMEYIPHLQRTVLRQINRFGFRDEQWRTDQNVFTIAVLGDSWASGYGVNKSDRFTEILERRLQNDSAMDVRVLNLGIGTFNTPEKVDTLQYVGLRFDPDLILLQLLEDDFMNTTMKWEYADQHTTASMSRPERANILLKGGILAREKMYEQPDHHLQAFLHRPLSRLDTIRGDIPVAVFYMRPVGLVNSTYIETAADSHGFTYLPIGERFDHDRFTFRNGTHPTPAGHRIIARELGDAITNGSLGLGG